MMNAMGPLPPGSPVYVARPLVAKIETLLLTGQYVTVIGGRQTGKTTVARAVQDSLLQSGVVTVYIDFQGYVGLSNEAWLRAVLQDVLVACKDDLHHSVQDSIAPPENPSALVNAFDTISRNLTRTGPFVILMDEITAVPSEFRHSFFSVIRSQFGQSSDSRGTRTPPYVLFMFLGTFDPADLIAEGPNSPFNVSREFNTADWDFHRDDVDKIASVAGVADSTDEIIAATGGHPYLTVRLIALMAEKLTVPQAVEQLFINDPNLTYSVRAVNAMNDEGWRIVRAILDGKTVNFAPAASDALRRLYVQGVIKRGDKGQAIIRCAIYESAFRPNFRQRWPVTRYETRRFGRDRLSTTG